LEPGATETSRLVVSIMGTLSVDPSVLWKCGFICSLGNCVCVCVFAHTRGVEVAVEEILVESRMPQHLEHSAGWLTPKCLQKIGN
jgi:hypothetical protein